MYTLIDVHILFLMLMLCRLFCNTVLTLLLLSHYSISVKHHISNSKEIRRAISLPLYKKIYNSWLECARGKYHPLKYLNCITYLTLSVTYVTQDTFAQQNRHQYIDPSDPKSKTVYVGNLTWVSNLLMFNNVLP